MIVKGKLRPGNARVPHVHFVCCSAFNIISYPYQLHTMIIPHSAEVREESRFALYSVSFCWDSSASVPSDSRWLNTLPELNPALPYWGGQAAKWDLLLHFCSPGDVGIVRLTGTSQARWKHGMDAPGVGTSRGTGCSAKAMHTNTHCHTASSTSKISLSWAAEEGICKNH